MIDEDIELELAVFIDIDRAVRRLKLYDEKSAEEIMLIQIDLFDGLSEENKRWLNVVLGKPLIKTKN